MKTFLKITIFFISLFVGIQAAHATVGGPTYIGDFKYNPTDESIYYTLVSSSGRGCPPILMRTSLTSKQTDVAFSCDQGEALQPNGDYNDTTNNATNKITSLTSGYKSLSSINLLKNNIQVDLTFIREEKVSPEEDYVLRNHFMATVYQNGTKVDEFPITGCSLDQPFTFAGYAILGFDKKIAMVSSAKGDCMEGGYTNEGLHIISNVNLIDKTTTNEYKGSREPLVPSESRLVVYEKVPVIATPSPTVDPVTTPPSTNSHGNEAMIILIAVVALTAGVLLGKNASK